MGKKIKIGLNKSVTDEKGQAFILVLILLVLGSLIITPLLAYMSSGLIVGQMHVRMTHEAYAADAGVEDAVWQIKTGAAEVPGLGGDPWAYDIADANEKVVNVTIENVSVDEEDAPTYKITSVATSDTGQSTTVESYVSMGGGGIAEALVSNNTITINRDSAINGGVYALADITMYQGAEIFGDVSTATGEISGGTVHGAINEGVEPLDWPTEVDTQQYQDEASVNYHDGDYDVVQGPNTITLGPLYVTGDLHIGKYNTILLEGTVYVQGGLKIDRDSNLIGSGNLICEQDLELNQMLSSDPSDFIFIMSTSGSIAIHQEIDSRALIYSPFGAVTVDQDANLTGSIIANNDIYLNKYFNVTYDPNIDVDIELPGGGGGGALVIHTYTIE